MFGYITPLKDELRIREYTDFKSYYCGLCFHIKKHFGNLPRMILNYDMTFLGLLLDSLSPQDNLLTQKACMANPLKKKPILLDNDALSYAAAMNVALVYFKLLDDKMDDHSLKSKVLALGLTPYKNKFPSSLQTTYNIIEKNLNKLTALENNKDFSSIDEIAHPFSLIVGHIFKDYPFEIVGDSPNTREHLFQFGYCLGKWIYIIDAIDDLEKDMSKSKFNPLDFLYNKGNLNFDALFSKIKDRINFTLLNCGTSVKEHLDALPLQRNEEILENIISLGMMEQYTKVMHHCSCQHKGGHKK
nr:DUF5685 family protein [uncultured Cellulosilyticum sp.]